MVHLTEVQVGVLPLKRFAKVIGRGQMREALKAGAKTRKRLAGRVVWNVNSTAAGGGVAELLQSLLCYARSVGIDARWIVIRGQPSSFRSPSDCTMRYTARRGTGRSWGSASVRSTRRPCTRIRWRWPPLCARETSSCSTIRRPWAWHPSSCVPGHS